MSVNDHGWETLKKAAEEDTTTSNPSAEYRYRVRVNETVMPIDRSGTGSITATNGSVSISTIGSSSVTALISGTWNSVVAFQGSVDGTNWSNISAVSSNGTIVRVAENGQFIIPAGGYNAIRVISTAHTSGTVVVSLNNGAGVNSVSNLFYSLSQQYRFSAVSTDLNMATASLDNPLILIRNPSGSNKILWIVSILMGCSVTNQLAVFRVFSNPTVTANGTSFTPRNLRVGDSSYSVSSLFNTLPSVSSSGFELVNSSLGQNNNSLELAGESYLSVLPNNSLLVTGSPGSNNRAAVLSIRFMEIGQ